MIRITAPARIVHGPSALEASAPELSRLGPTPVLIHGTTGEPQIRSRLDASLATAGLAPTRIRHEGLVTASAIAHLANGVRRLHGGAVIAVGGGRVIDAGKAAAHAAGVPCATIPTSPATCAAVTAIAVTYAENGRWSGPTASRTCPDVCVLDDDVLGAAPDRLLAAGVVDALVKVREVRLAAGRGTSPELWTNAALALCAVLEERVDPRVSAEVRRWPPDANVRTALASAVVWLPGLIAGLGGEANKLAAAHAVHNSLTWLPDHDRALHGELVSFGLLVQDALEGADDRILLDTVGWLRSLGIDPSLAGLGCEALWDDPIPILERAVEHPAMRTAFPEIDRPQLEGTVRRVDRIARAA